MCLDQDAGEDDEDTKSDKTEAALEDKTETESPAQDEDEKTSKNNAEGSIIDLLSTSRDFQSRYQCRSDDVTT